MNRKIVGVIAISLFVLSTLQAQDADIVADNLEYSREFYSGVHFSAIAESAPSFGYQRYPDNGPERIQCALGRVHCYQAGRLEHDLCRIYPRTSWRLVGLLQRCGHVDPGRRLPRPVPALYGSREPVAGQLPATRIDVLTEDGP